MDTIDYSKAAAHAAQEKKALKISLYELGKHANICEFMLVCSGSNEKQTFAIAEAIENELRAKFQMRPLVVEGKQTGQWIVMDYGSLIVHIFFDYVRDFYAIEKLWPTANVIQV